MDPGIPTELETLLETELLEFSAPDLSTRHKILASEQQRILS